MTACPIPARSFAVTLFRVHHWGITTDEHILNSLPHSIEAVLRLAQKHELVEKKHPRHE